MVEYHPSSPKDQATLHQFGKKVIPGIFLGYELIAGGIWKGDILIADLEDLEKLDASDIYPQRINAKEVLIRQKDDELIFPIADCTAKLSGTEYIQGESGESQLAESTDDAEAPIFGRSKMTSSIVITTNRHTLMLQGLLILIWMFYKKR